MADHESWPLAAVSEDALRQGQDFEGLATAEKQCMLVWD